MREMTAAGPEAPRAPEVRSLGELRAVAQDLESIHDRLEMFATSLEGAPAAIDRRRARRRLAATRKKILSFIGEMFTVQVRLQWICEGLREEGRPRAESAAEKDLDATEHLVGEIQCVLADRLTPGITALREAAGHWSRDKGRPR